MEGNNLGNDMVLLVEQYTKDSKKLHYSLQQAGYDCPVYVLEEDGFLPDGVTSVYGYFLGEFEGRTGSSYRPKYFNEIPVPDYWEIAGNGSSGNVHDLQKERAKIFYAEPKHKRYVNIVDWYDDQHVVRFCDHYNKYGCLFARTVFNAKGQKVNRSYFSAEGKSVIEENYVTKTIIVTEGETVTMFSDKMSFFKYFAEKTGLSQKRIVYNTLSTPFFISEALLSERKDDVLFWQEPERGDIPGNMQHILNGYAKRTRKIFVQNRAAYEKLISLGANEEMVKCLGNIYPFERESNYRPEVLICTNSDQVEHLAELSDALAGVKFHVAAITEMSEKLMSFERRDNISLYPNVKMSMLDELFRKCDVYLDINHQSEIVDAGYRAFLNNQLIMAFEETVHQRRYIAKEHIYPISENRRMITELKRLLSDRIFWKEKLREQQISALTETADCIQKALG